MVLCSIFESLIVMRLIGIVQVVSVGESVTVLEPAFPTHEPDWATGLTGPTGCYDYHGLLHYGSTYYSTRLQTFNVEAGRSTPSGPSGPSASTTSLPPTSDIPKYHTLYCIVVLTHSSSTIVVLCTSMGAHGRHRAIPSSLRLLKFP